VRAFGGADVPLNTVEDRQFFRLWFAEPLHALQGLPNGQGGFVALATSCFLYERYATAVLQRQGEKANRAGILRQLQADFSVDQATAAAFWAVIRNGILHQGMPLQRGQGKSLPSWEFRRDYPLMALEMIAGHTLLKVQPWKFMDRVLELWEANLDLLRASGSFPWATIVPVPPRP